MPLDAQAIIELLKLKPLPIEGGYFRQTYAAERTIDPGPAHGHPRPISTAIYYLLTAEPQSFSALHRLPTDEVFHFYLGSPVEMLLLHPGGESQIITLGPDLAAGQQVQFVVPAGCWQGSHLIEGGDFALLGTTMAPGYADADYQGGIADELAAHYPTRAPLIRRLSR